MVAPCGPGWLCEHFTGVSHTGVGSTETAGAGGQLELNSGYFSAVIYSSKQVTGKDRVCPGGHAGCCFRAEPAQWLQ